jgi:hypothetical protein
MRSNHPFSSRARIFTVSLLASFFVLVVSLMIQWLVYDDWLRETGPLHIVGTGIAALLTLVFMLRWQYRVREQQREMVRRFELISHMNDRIRNALQAIECVTYVSRLDETGLVRQEVEAIDKILREVLTETGFASAAEAREAEKAHKKSA